MMLLHKNASPKPRRPRRLSLPVFAMATLALLAAAGSRARAGEVSDAGSFFQPATVQRLNEKVNEIQRRFAKDVVIETFADIPASRRDQYSDAAKERFYDNWVTEEGKTRHADILILITRIPGHVQVGSSSATRNSGAFTAGDRDGLQANILIPAFRANRFDEGILQAVDSIEQTLASRSGGGTASSSGGAAGGASPSSGGGPSPNFPGQRTNLPRTSCGGGTGLGGLLCLVVGAIVLFMIIGAIFRQRSGGGYGYGGGYPQQGPGYGPPPPGGYGPGYGGGYGGGGGGGFGRGMLGGLFGGLLGGYAADRLMHHGDQAQPPISPGGGGGASSGGDFGTSAPTDTGPASTGFDFDAGGSSSSSSSSGGDFGSSTSADSGFDSSGGDFGGGGGGDFGGGGDSGGSSGGDF